jgi:hypothetical protein
MAYQFVSEDPSPAQKPLFESATQVTDYKTQKSMIRMPTKVVFGHVFEIWTAKQD